ncbi:MAG TPA: hypothetical protein VFE17_00660 [Candidatus Baltobacteraceae bacterium]|jgi:hypothetical protein|nr:hypothetical protein [Candidatus Baltobacteraceae bacterium]
MNLAYGSTGSKRIITGLMLVAVVLFTGIAAFQTTNFDFRAFYCAGAVARNGGDPYRSEPLHTCEREQTDATLSFFARDIVLPAPLPAYDIGALSLISRLPFSIASKVWTILLLLTVAGSAVALAYLAKAPLSAVTPVLWLSLGITSVCLGELIPLCVLSVLLAAIYARKANFLGMACAVGGAMVEPHIGLPLLIVGFVYVRQSRVYLAAVTSVLAIAFLLTAGVGGLEEYVRVVLPSHAASEIGSDAQLSLSVILHWLGASDSLALRAGAISYIAMIALAVVTAPIVAKKYDDDALLMAVPAALSIIGGVFIHVTEFAAAIPLVLLILLHRTERRYVFVIALILLAIPWWALGTPMLFGPVTRVVLAATVAAYLTWHYSGYRAGAALTVGLIACAFAAGVVYWHTATSIPYAGTHLPRNVLSAPYPEASWAWMNQRYMSSGSAASWLLRAPSWIAAGMVLVSLLTLAMERHRIKSYKFAERLYEA